MIVVLPSSKKALYDAVKKLCCVDYPGEEGRKRETQFVDIPPPPPPPHSPLPTPLVAVPSQCLLAKTLSKQKMLMSVTTKVAMQLNCKLGGELWAVEIPVSSSSVVQSDLGGVATCGVARILP